MTTHATGKNRKRVGKLVLTEGPRRKGFVKTPAGYAGYARNKRVDTKKKAY